MNKNVRKFKLSLVLAVVFLLLFSTMAFAYGYSYYPTYQNRYSNYSYSNYYAPQKYYYQPYYYNYYKYTPPVQQPVPQPQPKPQPQPTPAPQPAPAPAPAPAPVSGISADEKLMLDLVNKERAANGLQPLQIDMQLVKLARMKSQDMITNNYFSHTSPTYGSPFDMMKANGVTYRTAGENLAGAPSVSTAHTNLMNSEGHRKNILSSNFTHVGIGIIDGGPYGKMFTQLFIGK
ncbi:MAG: CAP domain-containing protein [Bacillota bacterium]